MTASYLWTYLISCWIKILYENLNKIKRRVCHKLMIHPLFCWNITDMLLKNIVYVVEKVSIFGRTTAVVRLHSS